jgi:hypothetical protein
MRMMAQALYNNDIPLITEDNARVRLYAWELWRTHSHTNNLTGGVGLAGCGSRFDIIYARGSNVPHSCSLETLHRSFRRFMHCPPPPPTHNQQKNLTEGVEGACV